jgi:hypothetical protein
MARVGFELTIPVFERAKTVHALDGAASVMGDIRIQGHRNILFDCYVRTFIVVWGVRGRPPFTVGHNLPSS